MSVHRWSGWPGAFCLDCGMDDPTEAAINCADCYVPCCEAEEERDPDARYCPTHAAMFAKPCGVTPEQRAAYDARITEAALRWVASEGGAA